MRVAIYTRVSTLKKRKRGDDAPAWEQSPEMQLTELRPYAAARGWTIEAELTDRVSGSTDSRPGLDTLMSMARARQIDAVVVWRFDRFARSLRHLVAAAEEFRALGVQFISLREQMDTTTPMGKAMFAMVGAMAELERDLIRERVQAGIKAAQDRGVKLGRPRQVVDIELARMLMHDDGLSIKQTAVRLGVPRPTLQRRLKEAAGK